MDQARPNSYVYSLDLGLPIRRLLLEVQQQHWAFSFKKEEFFYLRAAAIYEHTEG